MYLTTHEKSDCCGCTACANICGRDAIKMEPDPCGFLYPTIDPEKCVHCGLCEKVCPMEETYRGADASPDLYALQNKSREDLAQSTSGGMFSLLAHWILAQGGVIYGAAFDSDFTVRHLRAESLEEAMRFRTSKYVESDISQIYRLLMEDLRAGRTILFTGTPCQVNAVKKFLAAKKIDAQKLYTCDNICHGVPSRKLWSDYLDILNHRYVRPENPIRSVNMRSKRFSWKKQRMDVELENGEHLDDLMKDFSFNRLYQSLCGNRPSCFSCRYTSYKRPGDFTLGDFWNEENAGLACDAGAGMNLVLVNTPKGRALFEQLKEQAFYQPVTPKAAWQPHLEYPPAAPKKQAAFWKEYLTAADNPGKEAVMRKYMRDSFVIRFIRAMTPFLQKTGLFGLAGKLYKLVFVKGSK